MHRNQRTITNRTNMAPPTGPAYSATPPAATYTDPRYTDPRYADPRYDAPRVVDEVRDVGVGETYARRTFNPASAVGAIVGIALMVLGGIALARAGTGGDFASPDVELLGWSHNAPLAVAELAGGFLLLVAALTGVRGFLLFVSALLTVGGIVFAIEPTALDSLTIERSFAIAVAIASGVVLLMAALMPTVMRSTRHVEQDHVVVT